MVPKKSTVILIGIMLLMLLPIGHLRFEEGQAVAAGGPNIRLMAGEFDPLRDEPEIADALRSPTETGMSTYLLQFVGPVQLEWKQAVEDAGVRLYDYVPEYAFLVRMDPDTASAVEELQFVRWIGPYHPAYRLAPQLATVAVQNAKDVAGEPLRLTVQTLPDADLRGLAEQIKTWEGTVEMSGANEVFGSLRVRLERGRLDELAQQSGIVWIERYIAPSLQNDVAGGQIMNVNDVRASLGLYGAGQVIAVGDSGLDLGTMDSSMSDDFEGRIVDGQAICGLFTGGRNTWSDLNGHGTHVAGSALGNGVYSGSKPNSHDYSNSFAGIAPEANLVMQAIDNDGDPSLECVLPPSHTESHYFLPAYNQGARIHSNSWGGPTGGTSSNPEYGGYTSAAQAVDYSAWLHKDMLILYAAGNSGVDADSDGVVDEDSIGSPGTAKNVVTVGATENERPTQPATYDVFNSSQSTRFPVDPIRNDRMGDDPDGMAAFSSRGPTNDGRFKPDVVAPGTWIISTRSHHANAGTLWGAYNQHYAYSSGTSMATPLTAGAAAIVREWLTDEKKVCEPSSALMKATLLNGAVDTSPGQYGTGSDQEVPNVRPNSTTGWGRVDLKQSIDPPTPTKIWLKDESNGLQTGMTATYSVTVGANGSSLASVPLRVTLAWTDYYGSTTAAKALVNDLDLKVTAPNGSRYYGNSSANVPGPCLRGNADSCNNVESVFISTPVTGTYTLTVQAYNVPQGPQPFALVASGDTLREDRGLIVVPPGLYQKNYLPIVLSEQVCQ